MTARIRTSARFAFYLLTAILPIVLSAGTEAGAQAVAPEDDEFRPPLGETLEWLADYEPYEARIPEGAPERTSQLIPNDPLREELQELPGQPFYDLSNPPMARSWYKYPIYAVFGFPRDLIDGVFGFVSFIPVVNLPVVGVAYELVPTQIFFRDPRDWHRWPGRRNRNGHGFLDSESWGWFPTAHMMSFEHIDKRELAQWQRENEEMRFDLAERNRVIRAQNQAIRDRQETASALAMAAIAGGDGRTAIEWMLPYHLNYPRDLEAHGLYLASLAMFAQADDAPAWAQPRLWKELEDAPLQVLPYAEGQLSRAVELNPEAPRAVEALVYTQTRLGRADLALSTAESYFRRDLKTPRSPRRARLLFEAAMTAGDRAPAVEALEALEAGLGEVPGEELLRETLETQAQALDVPRVRLQLLLGDASEALGTLPEKLTARPEDPYYHYYLAVANLVKLQENPGLYDEGVAEARRLFERAFLLAGNPHLRRRSEAMLKYLDALEGRLPEEEPERDPGRFGDFGSLLGS